MTTIVLFRPWLRRVPRLALTGLVACGSPTSPPSSAPLNPASSAPAPPPTPTAPSTVAAQAEAAPLPERVEIDRVEDLDQTNAPPRTERPEAAAVRAAWVAGPLTGRDNSAARMREVRITPRSDGGYSIYVHNQFAWTCGLEFHPETGHPSALLDCRSAERGWGTSMHKIPLQCEARGPNEVCRGAYPLVYPDGISSPAEFRIVRRRTR